MFRGLQGHRRHFSSNKIPLFLHKSLVFPLKSAGVASEPRIPIFICSPANHHHEERRQRATVEPPSTAPPWSAAQPPSKGTEKIPTIMRIWGFFFNLLSQKFLIFRTKPNLTSPGLPIPNEAHPRTRRHVENLWNYPQHDRDRTKRRAQEEGGVWKESASRAEQTAKGFFLLPQEHLCCQGSSRKAGTGRDSLTTLNGSSAR